MSAALKLTGLRFGRLVVVQRVENNGRRSLWLCKCDCGQSTKVLGENLTSKSAHTESCGCLRRETVMNLGHRRHGVAAIKRSNARDARLADAERDAESRRIGGAVTAAATAGRQRKAPEPLPGAPKTWKHAAEALADLGMAW